MRRAFARKRETSTPINEDEFGWLGTSDANEDSPGSVWGFEERARFENPAINTSGPEEKRSYPAESPKNDTDWWSKPDLSEELLNTSGEVPSTEFVAPELTTAPPSFTQEDIEPPIEEPEEDYVVTPAYADIPVDDYEDAPTAPHAEALPQFEEVITPEPVVAAEPQPVIHEAPKLPAAEIPPQPVRSQPAAVPRPRVLDESVVLPHEASFATVALHQRPLSRSYSPVKEFSVKFTAGVKKYSPVMLLVVVFVAAIAYSLKFKSLDDNAPTSGFQNATAAQVPAQKPSSAPATQPQSEVLTKPLQASVPATEAEKPVTQPVETTNPVASKVAAHASDKTQTDATPKTKPAADQNTDATPKTKPAADQNTRPITKNTVAKQPASSPNVRKDEPPPAQPEKRAASTSDAETKSRQPDSDTKAAPNGGGDRPRRVNAPANSQSNSSGTQPQKPKLIDWP